MRGGKRGQRFARRGLPAFTIIGNKFSLNTVLAVTNFRFDRRDDVPALMIEALPLMSDLRRRSMIEGIGLSHIKRRNLHASKQVRLRLRIALV